MKKRAPAPENIDAAAIRLKTNLLPGPVSDSADLLQPWCWVAEAWIDSEGHESTSQTQNSIGVFAISVHEKYPIDVRRRLLLLQEIGQRMRSHVPAGRTSLWVYPGGYFGFDAVASRGGGGEPWPGFDAPAVRAGLPAVLRHYSPCAHLAIGADRDMDFQEVWLLSPDEDPRQPHTITRGYCELARRTIAIGKLRAAFFVCGEFTGSYTDANGPFCEAQHLEDAVLQLSDCRLLVDLAHSRVKGSVNGNAGPRLVHQLQMEYFSSHGAAVLTHHHPGFLTAGRSRDNSQSNWVILHGGKWLDEGCVHVVP